VTVVKAQPRPAPLPDHCQRVALFAFHRLDIPSTVSRTPWAGALGTFSLAFGQLSYHHLRMTPGGDALEPFCVGFAERGLVSAEL
jgi:hypothetical protein